MTDDYTVTVTLRRSLSEDTAEASRHPGDLARRLLTQVQAELQEAYDRGLVAGHFRVTHISLHDFGAIPISGVGAADPFSLEDT